jgi:oligopeptide/dipeptide ABC transporter ATP-binding protein
MRNTASFAGQVLDQPQNILEIEGLQMFFPILKGFLRRQVGSIKAVNDVDLSIRRNEVLGLVGESGCGKSTLGRCILRLYEPTGGTIHFDHGGERFSLLDLKKHEMRKMRRSIQMIFQDPFSSLNDRMTVKEIVGEPLLVNQVASGRELEDRVERMLVRVGLRPEHMRRYPHAFSGGQRQRIGIARALAIHPALVVADESVSALDVSVQAQIMNLLKELQAEFQLTYVFISHDFGVIRYLSDRIAVMYAGKIVEIAARDELLHTPRHPYTEALLSAVPRVKAHQRRDRILLKGNPPDVSNLPKGCAFSERCSYAKDICSNQVPVLRGVGEGHQAACHFAVEIKLRGI